MSKSFFILLICAIFTVILLFFPIYINMMAHYDMNRKKCSFSIYLFSILKIFGGYIATYPGGLAIHVSEKKAFILPYSQLNTERKRYSFMRTFRLVAFQLTTETGAEYLLVSGWLHAFLRTYFFIKDGQKENIKNNFWLIDEEIFKISLAFVVRFNLFILLRNFGNFIKQKGKALWQKKIKKSAI